MRTPALSICAAIAAAALLPAAATAQDSRPTSRPAKSPFPELGDPAGTYGAEVELDRATSLPTAAKKLNEVHGKPVRIDASITDVCRKKGCWMVIRDGDESVRVRFKDYGFFVPRDASGREVVVEGILSQKTISEEMAKHYAEEGGDPKKAEAIKGPQKVLAFMATAVEILGRRALPPAAEPTNKSVRTALAEKLKSARRVATTKVNAKTPMQAFAALRSVKGPRSVEFSLYAQHGLWLVFSRADAKPFTSGFAVKKGTGEIYRF